MNAVWNVGMPLAFLVSVADFMHSGIALVAQATFPAAVEGTARVIEPAPPGGTALIEWTIVKRNECPGQNARVWSGPSNFSLSEPLRPTSLPASEEVRVYLIPTDIPAFAPVGDLTLWIDGWYQCVGGPRTSFSLGPVTVPVPAPPVAAEIIGD